MPRPSKFKETLSSDRLVNNLSIKDALHMVRTEGGELTLGRVVNRLITALVIAGFTARAIVLGKATAIHLFLPMLAEYTALLFAVPILRLILPDPGIRPESRKSLWFLVIVLIIGSIWNAIDAAKSGRSFTGQLGLITGIGRDWIVDHQMHWPMLGAAASVVIALPSRVQILRKHGPPFFPVGLGCSMRLVVLIVGSFLIPWLWGNSTRLTWGLWSVLILAEIGALWLHWDMQKCLQKRGIKV